MKAWRKIEDSENKLIKKNELKEMKQSLKRLAEDLKNDEHISLIERLTSNGEDLMSPDKLNSQNVLDLIMQEHELDSDNE